MNKTMPFNMIAPALNLQAAPRHAAAPSRLARLLRAFAAFFAPGDDPAALRYIASKYNGEGD
jgi:hypothetical protein